LDAAKCLKAAADLSLTQKIVAIINGGEETELANRILSVLGLCEPLGFKDKLIKRLIQRLAR
jgi:hypothetical protein